MSFQSASGLTFRAGGRMTIGTLVDQIKYNFLSRQLDTLDGSGYNQYDTLKKIYLYLDNRFESGPLDSQGNRKYFYNLGNSRNDQATKNIDLDSKDLYPRPDRDSETDYLRAFLMKAEWLEYVKDTNFGMKLNQLAEDLPRYGSVVWKKKKGDEILRDVDLRNIICDPTGYSLKDGPMIERMIMRSGDMTSMSAWDQEQVEAYLSKVGGRSASDFMDVNEASLPSSYAIDELIPEYEVYEFWGHVPETVCPWVDNPNPNKTRYVMAVIGGQDQTVSNEYVFYFKEVSPELFPYKELHYRRLKGRWLGQGNVERLFPLQERANELVNRFYRSIRIGTAHYFQTRDRLFTRNVFTDLDDGEIIESKSEITPIATEVRAFNQYQAELRTIEAQADRDCTTFEIVTGETLPTNTPFRLGALQAASAGKVYDFIRENIGLFLEDVGNNWVLPSFAKRMNREHILEIAGSTEDIQKYDAIVMKYEGYKEFKKYVLATNELPTPEEVEMISKSIAEQILSGDRKVSFPKDFFSDLSYSISFNATNEAKNSQAKVESLTNLLQILATNPQALQNPQFARVLSMALEASGAVSSLALASLMGGAGLNAVSSPALQGGAPGRQSAAPNATGEEGGLTPESVAAGAEAMV